MAKTILIRPIVSEKANDMADKSGKYTFAVHDKANKLVIKQAVQKMYNVTVEDVNTTNTPYKVKSRSTKTAVLRGRKSGYKKAVVTLSKGETIDIYGSATEENETTAE